MALVRTATLKNALTSTSAVSSGATGSAYDLSSIMAANLKLYAAVHVTALTTHDFQAFVQSASSSGFGTASTDFIFTSRTCTGAEWGTPVVVASTSRVWFRTRWTLSTAGSTPTARFLDWISIK